MLYESYKDKLERRRRRFERLWHFRLFFLLGLLLLLAGAAALMGVAGIVTDTYVPASVAYGEPLGVSASAVFREAGFEYRAQGTEEWSTVQPRAAGVYECRAVGASIVGTGRAGEIYTFRIEPTATTVRAADNVLMYGEEPAFSAQLYYEDVLHVGNYFAEEIAGGYRISPDPASVTILSGDGEDVTASYLLQCDGRDVRKVARPLSVRTATAAFGYDGQPHRSEEVVFGGYGLAEGHRFSATFPERTEAGSASNRITDLRICDAEGNDVTGNYAITYDFGTLTVEPRKISVATSGETRVYDGAAHVYGEEWFALAEGGLAAGERFELSGLLSARDAGEYVNAPTVRIFADGNETTKNYEIETSFAAVHIGKRALSAATRGETRVYDGEAHTYGEEWFGLAEGEPAEGEQVQLSGLLTAQNAGEYVNAPAVRIFAGGRETTQNYEIETSFATVVIQKRVVGVKTATAAFPYDGQPHGDDGFEILPAAEGRYGLAGGHALTARSAAFVTEYSETPVPNELVFTVTGGGNVTQNYDVRIEEYGALTVERRAVTIRAASDELIYNGQPQSVARFEACEDLVLGHRASGTFPAFVNASTYANEPTERRILDASGNDVTKNYIPSWQAGSVTISRRAVTLKTGSATAVYDALPHSAPTAAAVSPTGLAGGHRVEAVYPSWTDAGEHENRIDPATAKVYDGGGNDVTENYTLTWESGQVVIGKRPAQVVSRSAQWMYDAQPHSERGFDATGLAEGHTFRATVVSAPSVTAVKDSCANTLVYSGQFIGTADGENLIGNYEVTYADGSLTVEKRPVTVVTLPNDTQWVYDGVARAFEKFEADYSAAAKLAGHEVRATFSVTDDMADAGSHENRCEAKIFADGQDVTENYAVSYRFGRVTVEKRPLLLETESQSFVYDDAPHEWRAFHETEGQKYGLLHGLGHAAEVVGATAVTEVSSRENVLRFRITAAGKDVTGNYDVQTKNGAISVTKREVTLLTGSGEFEYDAQPHSVPSFTEKTGTLVGGHTLSAVYPERTDAGSEQNIAAEVRITRGGAPISLANYEIRWEYGTLRVRQREVKLQTESGEFVYDAEEHRVTGYRELVGVPVGDGLFSVSLVRGHTLSAVYPARTDKGTTENIFTEVRILSGGADVTANYRITWDTPGNIVVTARPVTVTTGSGSHVYDAQPFEVRTYEYETFNAEKKSGLVAGHVLTAAVQRATALVGAEKKENVLDLVFTVMAGERNVTENYTFEVTFGTIEVTPRSVTVTPGSAEKMYDGKPLEARECDYEKFDAEKGTGLVTGHVFKADILSASSLTNVGRSPNLLTYDITVTDEKGENVTQNYNFIKINGVLIVTTRPVTVILGGGGWVYCGEPRACENFTTDDMLLEGHEVRPAYNKFLDAGTYPNNADKSRTKIFAANQEDVTGNYEITIDNSDATVVISRRPITVSDLKGGTWVYDGNPHSSTNFICEEEGDDRGLLTSKGHTFGGAAGVEVTDITDVFDRERGVYTDIGTKENGITMLAGSLYNVTIKDKDNQFIQQNYIVTPGEMAPLRVKSPIVVHVYHYTKWYDGEPLAYDPAEDFFLEMLPPDVQEEWVTVKLGGSVTEIGALTLADVASASVCTVFDGKTDLTAQNGFRFTGAERPLEVTKRPLGIRSLSADAERSDQPFSVGDGADAYWVYYGALLPGHELRCTVTGVLQPDEAQAPNTLSDIRVVDGNGNDVTKYYDVESMLDFGTLRWIDEEEPSPAPAAVPGRKEEE